MEDPVPHYPRPPSSLIVENLGPDGVSLYIGDSVAARDIKTLGECGITTVVNCAVNLDINYVAAEGANSKPGLCDSGSAPVRTYKIGLIDGDGNPETMMLSGYYLLHGALHQTMPVKPSYLHREKGNILVNCRGGRSRSVCLVALYLAAQMPDQFPDLDAAIAHVREKRELHPDEWFEAPKPMLEEAARKALETIKIIEPRYETAG